MKKQKTVRNLNSEKLQNGLTDALGLGSAGVGQQINQLGTIWQSQRWYLISNQRQILSEMYVEKGLIQTVVDLPVDDALRGGIEIHTKQLSEEDIQELQIEIERQGDIVEVGQGMKWNRLFGGAGIIIMTEQDPKTPLDVKAITEDTQLEFRAVDMWELFYDKQNAEGGYDASIADEKFDFYNYYGQVIHKSRIIRLKGLKAPSFVRPKLRGWGFSVVEGIVESINQYWKNQNVTFEVMDEFKVDIFKLDGLVNTLLMPEGTNKVKERVQLANQQKNFQNAIVLDNKDDYQSKQLAFSGLSEIMTGTRMQLASDLRMPLTKLFGISAGGFSSGEDDIENYNSNIESSIRSKCKFELIKIIGLRCQHKFGFVPSDLMVNFKPLRVLSSEQEENIKTQKYARLKQNVDSGYMSVKEFKDAVNKGKLLEIQIDTSLDKIETGISESDGGIPSTPAPKSVTQAPGAKS